ncbi:hypothetical protein B1790_27605 [Mycobacterium sp. AT1]|nr:hypothetical protein B1790_27605 [Mycobacterium sp. AT1]
MMTAWTGLTMTGGAATAGAVVTCMADAAVVTGVLAVCVDVWVDEAASSTVLVTRVVCADVDVAGLVRVLVAGFGFGSSADLFPCVEVCAPPEEDTVTPGATASTVCDVPVPPPLTGVVGPDGLPVAGGLLVGCGEVSTPDGPVVSGVLLLLGGVDLSGLSLAVSESAHAMPAGAAMADPIPRATAKAPIRPTYLLCFMLRDPKCQQSAPCGDCEPRVGYMD